jgi:REP element-mobilizing transposase RayT
MRSKLVQHTLHRRGGLRHGAGRKPNGERALVPHVRRARIDARVPVLVTWKLRDGLSNLRRPALRGLLLEAIASARDRHALRLVHYSIQSNHVHAIVEARDATALARGAQGLSVRIAKALNRAWGRRGRVFADRYHSRALRTPREVRYALAYVLNNARKHGARVEGIDPYSSGAAFDGWREPRARDVVRTLAPPVVRARAWLLTTGWRRHGLVGVTEVPGPK